MTILINGSDHLPAGDREKALAETADLVAETRTQKGCRPDLQQQNLHL